MAYIQIQAAKPEARRHHGCSQRNQGLIKETGDYCAALKEVFRNVKSFKRKNIPRPYPMAGEYF